MAKPKKEKFSSFEVTEYDNQDRIQDKYSIMTQIMKDKERKSPSFGVNITFQGNLAKLSYHTYESMLPQKMTVVMAEAKERLDEAVKYLKKEYKSITKKDLELKEDKAKSNHTVQKVSMNERYYAVFWRFYEVE